ncbi:MAG: hypothetical protein ACPGEC_04950 [Flavobacteriales bacterium]
MRQLHFYLGLVFSLLSFSSLAQMEERSMTRKANASYQDSLFTKATLEYKQALEIHDFDTNRFNMAVSLFAEENTEEAIKEWELVEKKSDNKTLKSFCVYNKGLAQLKSEKQEEALESFKQALRYQPKNEMARHNYWFLKLLLDSQPQQEQQNQDNKDNQDKKDQDKKDQEQNQDQNKDGDSENGDGDKKKDEKTEEKQKGDKDSEKEEKQEEKEDAEDNKEDEDGEKQDKKDEKADKNKAGEEEKEDQKEGENANAALSKAEALQLLEAIDESEDNTHKRIKAQMLKEQKRKAVNKEKDW